MSSAHDSPLAARAARRRARALPALRPHRHAGRPRESTTYPSTRSSSTSRACSSSELRALGLDDVELTEHGYVFATLPGARRADGRPARPRRHEPRRARRRRRSRRCTRATTAASSWPGSRPRRARCSAERIGHDIVTSDGTTLLGADDKAGVAEIMAAVAYLVAHPEIPHAPARIAFTVDEEIGRGTDHFDLERVRRRLRLHARRRRASARSRTRRSPRSSSKVTFHGVGVHPGTAKGKLVNPVKLAARFVDEPAARRRSRRRRPRAARASSTRPRSTGGADAATVTLILRDFDWDELARARGARAPARRGGGRGRAARARDVRALGAVPQHARRRSTRLPHVVEAALEATRRAGLEPKLHSIRGGTDGSRLTEMGLPTPNVFTGGNEYHSVREWISVQDMAVSRRDGRRAAEALGRARAGSSALDRLTTARRERHDSRSSQSRSTASCVFGGIVGRRRPWVRRSTAGRPGTIPCAPCASRRRRRRITRTSLRSSAARAGHPADAERTGGRVARSPRREGSRAAPSPEPCYMSIAS